MKKTFTLIELVLVVLLISILIGLSAPSFKRTFKNLEIYNSCFNLSKLAQWVQDKAIIERNIYKIKFDLENKTFWIVKKRNTEFIQDFERIQGKYGRVFSLPSELKFVSEKKEIVFFPDGRCKAEDIKILDKQGAGCSLCIKDFGANVEIKEIEI